MANDLTHVRGFGNLTRNLQAFPTKVKPVLRGSLRAGAKNVVLPEARRRVHSVSGLLAAGLKVGTSSRGDTVRAYVRASGPHAHVAKWIEYGTKPHRIPKLTVSQRVHLAFGGRVVSSINHPGARPKPFLRPALDNVPPIMREVVDYVRMRIEKLGGNASAVTIDGEFERLE